MRQQRGTASTVRTVRGLAGTTGEVAGPPAAPGQASAVFVLTEVPGFASGFASGFAGFLPTQVARHPSSRAVLWLEAAPASVLGLSPEACSGDPGYPNRCGSFAWGAPASTGSRGGPTGCAAAPLPRSCSSRHQAPALGDRDRGPRHPLHWLGRQAGDLPGPGSGGSCGREGRQQIGSPAPPASFRQTSRWQVSARTKSHLCGEATPPFSHSDFTRAWMSCPSATGLPGV